MLKKSFTIWGVIALVVLLTACGEDDNVPTPVAVATLPGSELADVEAEVTADVELPATVTPTPTPAPPTPTPEPLAALVNGLPITQMKFERELARFEQAATQLGLPADPARGQAVLNALVEQELMTQAALAQGLEVTPAEVETELAALRESGDLDTWLQDNLYTEDEFREQVRRGMLVEQLIALVTSDVPEVAEQIHARTISVSDPAQATELRQRVLNGDDFAFLAEQFSLGPGNGGDIGWFARGSLVIPELEDPVFALQNEGDLTEIIPIVNADGSESYYFLQLIERDPVRPLTAEMRAELLQAALFDWLAVLRNEAIVEEFVETGS